MARYPGIQPITTLVLLLGGCSAQSGANEDGDGGIPVVERDGETRVIRDPGAASDHEICGNGLDDDGDGLPDDSCTCAAGERQGCWLGPVVKRSVGACSDGFQDCEQIGEFPQWGPCQGAVLPTEEVPGNEVDEDCDGSEPFDGCLPSEFGENCGDGVDNDCDRLADCEDPDCDGACRSGCVPREYSGSECLVRAPAGSFEPAIQWSWTSGTEPYSWVTPLVANLTDDTGDGVIDLCDTPDIVVVAFSRITETPENLGGHIYVLDGATGSQHARFAHLVSETTTPALGDIDGDRIPEIVTATTDGHLIAFEHDGTHKWTSDAMWRGDTLYQNGSWSAAVALADLDNDGDVEIIAGNMVLDHNGSLVWDASPPPPRYSATVAADLDGDRTLEVIVGREAYRHDGSPYYVASAILPGFPQVANLDDDPEPEVLVTTASGLSVLEHDGTVKFRDTRPTGVAAGSGFFGSHNWARPAAVHDFDGDGVAEFAHSSATNYALYEGDGTLVWQATVSDLSGIAAGTAFDFLGDGSAEAIYGDESRLWVFDDEGTPVLDVPRASRTVIEYPVVADVDNDGSAEIVVVSNEQAGVPAGPTVQVIRDVSDRWVPSRRIWNQHTYHVSNVREDGTIPQFEPPSHRQLNTFRTNAQVERGQVCMPGLI